MSKHQKIKIMRVVSVILFLFISVFASDELLAQGGHRRERHVVKVRHSRFRPKHVVVFKPHWHPRITFHRRWVYFPRYNFYWDNWRNHYYYFNGTVWISKSKAPSIVTNVDLSKVKYFELDESEDDNNEIALANEKHKGKYSESD